MIIFHDPRCVEYSAAGHPERPARIQRSVPLLKERHKEWEWSDPKSAREAALLRAHTPQHLERIRAAAKPFDTDTPNYSGIHEHALRAAGGALDVGRGGLQGKA